jgi:hypothetical protein
MKALLAAAIIAVSLFFGAGNAAAQNLCPACQKFGQTCCALQSSIGACVVCGQQYGYTKDVAERFCQKNQPQCTVVEKRR